MTNKSLFALKTHGVKVLCSRVCGALVEFISCQWKGLKKVIS